MTTVVIVVAFIIFMGVAIRWFWKIRHQQVNAIASIVTVIGVLGTFAGITWGLFYFDTSNIEASVPKLLEGLKVAFLTSIAGILGSIYLKWSTLHEQAKQPDSDQHTTGATVDDLKYLLEQILAVEKTEGKETRESLQSIEKSLTGDGDSTVLTQLQKLRTTFSDKQDDLVSAFNQFAEQMAENNSKALIEALEEVMRDFNAKINEQFGDNFKQLNEAVGRINEWQEQYRQQMDKLAEEFRIAAESVERSRESLQVIADRSSVIVSSAETLEPILQGIQHQINQLNASLEAFSKLADNAKEAFPIIETRLDELTNGFSQVVQSTIDNSHASMERQREALAEQAQQIERTVENTGNYIQQQTIAVFERTSEQVKQVIDGAFQGLRSALENQYQQLDSTIVAMNQRLTDTVQNQSTQLNTLVQDTTGKLREMGNDFSTAVRETIQNSQTSMESQRESLNNLVGNLSRDTEQFIQDNTRRMTDQIRLLDEALAKVLTDSLRLLGSHLTSLSGKFVADYTPLTNHLREVVEIARNLPISERFNQPQQR